jgi:hypothetical protein
MITAEVEQFAALADNWTRAQGTGDGAAATALEDELHARLASEEIRKLGATGAEGDQVSPAQAAEIRQTLVVMWNNASARLD